MTTEQCLLSHNNILQRGNKSFSKSCTAVVAFLLLNNGLNLNSSVAVAFVNHSTKRIPPLKTSHNNPSFLIFSQSNDSDKNASSRGTSFSSSSLDSNGSYIASQRLVKHKMRRKKMRQNARSGPLSKEELAKHVASQYVSGSGGIFKEVDAKRKRQELQRHKNGETNMNKEQVEYLKKLDRHPALVLNADYQPLRILPLSLSPWQETIKALFSGKVSVVETYSDIHIRGVTMDVPLPSVIVLSEYVAQPNNRPAFTRRNVFLRDGYRCQYCANRYRTSDLSLDHVMPRCRGGKLEWENAVTCCRKCNSRKGSTLPNNLRSVGMKLRRQPIVPTKYDLAGEAGKMVPLRVHPTWKPFLGIEQEEEEEGRKSGTLELDSRNYFDDA